MKYNPHEYQKYAIEYIKSHPRCALFLDMGLGKSSITLTALYDLMYDSFDIRRVLVIAPLRVARDTWTDEVHKWDHLGRLRVSVAVGSEVERQTALRSRSDIVTINRENVAWLVSESGYAWDFDCVVIDELSSFKNHQSKRFKALRKKLPYVSRVIGLTGTPAPNSLMDLWAEFFLVDNGERLGRFIGRYRDTYFLPDKRNGNIVFSYKPRKDAEDSIYRRLSDITISMKAVDHLDMPELMMPIVKVHMSPEEASKYQKLKNDLVLDIGGSDKVIADSAASLCGKLTQMANGAIYSPGGDYAEFHSRKLDALEDLIEASNGKPVLVAYWFKHDRERIAERLNKLGIQFDDIGTADSIRKWNSRSLSAGLIHPASAGHGLNLQSGGNTLIWFGLTWSLELYQQTNARLWRQGQKEGRVTIYRIATEGTIDERIMLALESKDVTQESLIRAVRATLEEGAR